MDKKELLQRIDHLIEKGEAVHRTKKEVDYMGAIVNMGLQTGFRTASLSFIKNLYGESHPFYSDFNERVRGKAYDETVNGLSILRSIKYEVENDLLISIKEKVSADIFSDFLEMSRYFLDQKFKDPAAVMIGSVLEEHLRLLCNRYKVNIEYINRAGKKVPKKADIINSELVKAEVYGVLEQKSVTTWLHLRNSAAHGKYLEYTIEHVEQMYQGVLYFIMKIR